MTKINFKTIFMAVIITAITGVFLSSGTFLNEATAAGTVPEWFKGVAGFWAQGLISTAEFLAGIEFLLAQEIIEVEGYGLLVDALAQGVDQDSHEEIWASIDSLQDQIDNIQLIPGPTATDVSISTYVNQITQTARGPQSVKLMVECSEGDYVTGGGFGVNGGNWEILRSCPAMEGTFSCMTPNQTTPDGWKVWARYHGSGYASGESLTAFVSCIDVTP